ncbi:hypothetical protein C2S51_021987 [Perilla frutescens var. frutescens]|nr:hypothetical protein C2S51_021987 [Perilla frutescens var. frutescens]
MRNLAQNDELHSSGRGRAAAKVDDQVGAVARVCSFSAPPAINKLHSRRLGSSSQVLLQPSQQLSSWQAKIMQLIASVSLRMIIHYTYGGARFLFSENPLFIFCKDVRFDEDFLTYGSVVLSLL